MSFSEQVSPRQNLINFKYVQRNEEGTKTKLSKLLEFDNQNLETSEQKVEFDIPMIVQSFNDQKLFYKE